MSCSFNEDLVNLCVANLTNALVRNFHLKVISFGNILDVFVCNIFKFQASSKALEDQGLLQMLC